MRPAAVEASQVWYQDNTYPILAPAGPAGPVRGEFLRRLLGVVRGVLLGLRSSIVLLEEKTRKLFGITRLLDELLPPVAANLLLSEPPPSAGDRQRLVERLNAVLASVADGVARAFPGTGVGYYAAAADAIVAYGPSSELGTKVGLPVGAEHIGRRAMAEGRELAGIGHMVRGDILNCVRPLVRDGQVVGFAWANETIENLYRQLHTSGGLQIAADNAEIFLGADSLLAFAVKQFLKARALRAAVAEEGPAAAALTAVVDYLARFLEAVPLVVLIAEEEGQIIFANEAGREVFRLAASAATTIWSALAAVGLDVGEVEAALARGGSPQALSAKVKAGADGSGPAAVDLVLARLGVEGKAYLLVVGAQTDEAENRWRAAKLAAAGEVAVAMAHEIRNPLTIIRGAIRLLPDRLFDREFLLQLARVLEQEIAHIDNTLEALLAFTKAGEPRFETVNVVELIRRTVCLIEPYACSQGVTIEKELPRTKVFVEGDARQLRQALLNVLVNAVQAMPNGGLLHVRCVRRPGSNLVEITVRDTGTGIPPGDQARVFDVFYTKKPGGTGLGLALVQRILDEHGGFIRLESEVGKGTTFTMVLPAKTLYIRQALGGAERC